MTLPITGSLSRSFREWFKGWSAAVSNLRRSRTAQAARRHVPATAAAILLACAAVAAGVAGRVRADDNPFQAWASLIAYTPARYRGPTIAFAGGPPRPAGPQRTLRSARWPLAVHAPPGVPWRRLAAALRALEGACDWLYADGWPLPYPDGGRGGSLDFDLYLVPGAARAASAGADALLGFTAFDAASSFALLDAALPPSALPRCALDALAQAALFGRDPAEPESARRATAAFIVWLARGELGCEDAVMDSQAAPALGLVGDAEPQTAGLGLLLSMLSRRHDGGSGRFVQELWEIARQHSERPSALHAEPSLWQALSAALDKAGETLDQAVEELAVARYFAPGRQTGGALPALPAQAAVPVARGPALAALPAHLPVSAPGLATYGSAYTRVDTRGARSGQRLLVWLRGERGVRWSLQAVRLDTQGRELGRMEAPPRRLPDSFLPVELSPQTEAVLLVVTKLPLHRPGERAQDDDEDFFRLILDKGE